MTLRATNLNLVPVLRALLREGSVSAAAKSVGLSQPATSHALAKLRLQLNDPLLYRAGQGMRLTPRALRIAEELEDVCAALERIFDEGVFDPATAQRTFIVGAPDYVAHLLAAFLAHRLPIAAPGISVRFVSVPTPVDAALLSGRVDLIIRRKQPEDVSAEMMTGYKDRMVGLVRRDHPLAGVAAPDAADIACFSQVRQQRASLPGPAVESWPDLGGRISLSLEHFLSSALVAAQSDSFAVTPYSLAHHLKSVVPVDTFELSDAAGAAFESSIRWGPMFNTDPPHQWFRALVDEGMRSHLAE